jgi:hypothetical protein
VGTDLALGRGLLGTSVDQTGGFLSLRGELKAKERAFRLPALSYVSGGMSLDQFRARLGEHKEGIGKAIAWWILRKGVSKGLGLPL